MAWRSKLSEPIRLDGDRGELKTLKDAAEFLQREFRSITRNETLHGALEDLMRAADSGELADRRAATEQLRLFLRSQRMLSGGSSEDIQARLRRQLRLDRRS